MHNNTHTRMNKLRPVLFVKDPVRSLEFWTERIGFEVIFQWPTVDPEFSVLHKDGIEIVIHGTSSDKSSVPAPAVSFSETGTVLYLEVSSLAAVFARTQEGEVVMPLRRTAYGATEFAVREPGGNVICFSQFQKHAPQAQP